MTDDTQAYDLVAIRELLLAAFTAEDLRRFCQGHPTFRPIVNCFGPGHGFDDMVDEVVDYCETHLLFVDLLTEVRRENPRQHERFGPYLRNPKKLFLCYKRHAKPDRTLAQYLSDFLAAQGHIVFIDNSLRSGDAWLDRIDQEIKTSDFLIVLLSEASADSEMVQAEISRAYDYRKLQGRPHTLPVRVAYEGLLPYPIHAFLDSLHYVLWEGEADDLRVGRDILAAMEGRPEPQKPTPVGSAAGERYYSNDGRPVADGEDWHPPLPEFDPRLLEELDAPGGAVRLSDQFYVERNADRLLKHEVVRAGTTTTIRAPRQAGKSSLWVRGIHHARQRGVRVVSLDLQLVDEQHLATSDLFLRYLAEVIVHRLRLDRDEVERSWCSSLGPGDKLTCLMEDYVLAESETPILLAMDEADLLLPTPFHKDFFALIRSWHNMRALDGLWNRLNILMVISTEPHLLIPNVNQSPFNVGLKLYLQDFDEAQVRDLNWRHGSPVKDREFGQFLALLGGHPYLTRKALYTLVMDQLSWADLVRTAATDQGPFADHLRHYHWLLRDEPALTEALRQVIDRSHCPDEDALLRLQRAGLVRVEGELCRCRCDLYRQYFEGKLQ